MSNDVLSFIISSVNVSCELIRDSPCKSLDKIEKKGSSYSYFTLTEHNTYIMVILLLRIYASTYVFDKVSYLR